MNKSNNIDNPTKELARLFIELYKLKMLEVEVFCNLVESLNKDDRVIKNNNKSIEWKVLHL